MKINKYAVRNLAGRLGHIGRSLITGICPRICPLCERDLDPGEDILCLDCLARLPRVRQSHPDLSIVHLGAPGGCVRVISWFVYNHEHPSHRLIHNIKYHDHRFEAVKLGREFGREVMAHGDLDNAPIDIILPIPLHWKKHLKRSYNQAAEIARGFAEVTGCRTRSNLHALRPHSSQTERGSLERSKNVDGIFAVRNPADLDGRHVAILDDVITTGATVNAAIEAIISVSAPASITALSLANTRLD